MAEVSRCAQASLKSAGYRRSGNHLYRQSDDLVHALHFQGSQWGTATEGQFTINLLVISRAVHEACLTRRFPANPATAFPLAQCRIGFAYGNHDVWWSVSDQTDIAELSDNVVGTVANFGLAFFESYTSELAVLSQLRTNSAIPGLMPVWRPLVHAVLAERHGFRDEAESVIGSAIAGARTPKQAALLAAQWSRAHAA